MSDINDTLDLPDSFAAYSRRRNTVTFAEFEETNPNEYNLIKGSGRNYFRLRVVREDGSSFAIPYDYIEIMEISAGGQYLTLLMRSGLAVTFEGTNLSALAELLEECNIKKLHIYDPQKHTLTNPNAPIITAISEGGAGT